jgi:hypothetical protein
VFGFPPDWEECAAKLLAGDSSTDVLSGSTSDLEEFATHPESNIFNASLFRSYLVSKLIHT